MWRMGLGEGCVAGLGLAPESKVMGGEKARASARRQIDRRGAG